MGLKAPKGWGWLTNARRAAYNRIYYRTTFGLGRGCLVMIVAGISVVTSGVVVVVILME